MKNATLRLISVCCAAALLLALSACGGSAASSNASGPAADTAVVLGSADSYDYQNFTPSQGLDQNGFWEGVRALDYVTLPEDFASLTLARGDVEPTEEEIQECVDALLDSYVVTLPSMEGTAQEGDTVNIDYSGSVDGVVFLGGTAEGYNLTLGSGAFIPGFEEQIIGHKPGETFDISVTFPDGYGDATDADGNVIPLAGQNAVFRIVLNYISEEIYPELTDEWIEKNFSETDGLHTVAELRGYYNEILSSQNMANAVIENLLSRSTFAECPETVVRYQVCQCLNYYASNAAQFGCTLDEFLQNFTAYADVDEMLQDYTEDILSYSREALMYQAVAETLGVSVTDEMYEPYADYAESYGGENYLRMYLLVNNVLDLLCEGAQVA